VQVEHVSPTSCRPPLLLQLCLHPAPVLRGLNSVLLVFHHGAGGRVGRGCTDGGRVCFPCAPDSHGGGQHLDQRQWQQQLCRSLCTGRCWQPSSSDSSTRCRSRYLVGIFTVVGHNLSFVLTFIRRELGIKVQRCLYNRVRHPEAFQVACVTSFDVV